MEKSEKFSSTVNDSARLFNVQPNMLHHELDAHLQVNTVNKKTNHWALRDSIFPSICRFNVQQQNIPMRTNKKQM